MSNKEVKTYNFGFKGDFIFLFTIALLAFVCLCFIHYNSPNLSINRADKMDCIMVEDGDTLSVRSIPK